MRAISALGAAFVIIGIITPKVIYQYEVVHHLDISRDVGVLPWMVLTAVGAFLLVQSLLRRR